MSHPQSRNSSAQTTSAVLLRTSKGRRLALFECLSLLLPCTSGVFYPRAYDGSFSSSTHISNLRCMMTTTATAVTVSISISATTSIRVNEHLPRPSPKRHRRQLGRHFPLFKALVAKLKKLMFDFDLDAVEAWRDDAAWKGEKTYQT